MHFINIFKKQCPISYPHQRFVSEYEFRILSYYFPLLYTNYKDCCKVHVTVSPNINKCFWHLAFNGRSYVWTIADAILLNFHTDMKYVVNEDKYRRTSPLASHWKKILIHCPVLSVEAFSIFTHIQLEKNWHQKKMQNYEFFTFNRLWEANKAVTLPFPRVNPGSKYCISW